MLGKPDDMLTVRALQLLRHSIRRGRPTFHVPKHLSVGIHPSFLEMNLGDEMESTLSVGSLVAVLSIANGSKHLTHHIGMMQPAIADATRRGEHRFPDGVAGVDRGIDRRCHPRSKKAAGDRGGSVTRRRRSDCGAGRGCKRWCRAGAGRYSTRRRYANPPHLE